MDSQTVDPASTTTATFPGLSKGTNYRVRVAGTNVRGLGPFSDYVEIETLVDCKLCT